MYKGLGDRVNRIPANELTISIFRDKYPRELFKALGEEGLFVEEEYEGIYYIRGRVLFDTQVVVTSRLKGGGHRSLRLLSPHAQEEDVRGFVEEALKLTEPEDRNNVEAVLQVSIAANQELYHELRRGTKMCDALRDLMKEEIAEEKRKARREGLEEGREEGREAGRQEGREEGRQEGREETLMEMIHNLMANMKWSEDQAMEAMNIPVEKRASLRIKI